MKVNLIEVYIFSFLAVHNILGDYMPNYAALIRVIPLPEDSALVVNCWNGKCDYVSPKSKPTNIANIGQITGAFLKEPDEIVAFRPEDVIGINLKTRDRNILFRSTSPFMYITNYSTDVLLATIAEARSLFLVNIEIGKRIWTSAEASEGIVHISSNRVYVASNFRRNGPAAACDLRCVSLLTGVEFWRQQLALETTGIPTTIDSFDDGLSFWVADSGSIRRLSLVDGNQLSTFSYSGIEAARFCAVESNTYVLLCRTLPVHSNSFTELARLPQNQIARGDTSADTEELYSFRGDKLQKISNSQGCWDVMIPLSSEKLLAGRASVGRYDLAAKKFDWNKKGQFRSRRGSIVYCLDNPNPSLFRVIGYDIDTGRERKFAEYSWAELFGPKGATSAGDAVAK
jgi:hypothetical protein